MLAGILFSGLALYYLHWFRHPVAAFLAQKFPDRAWVSSLWVVTPVGLLAMSVARRQVGRLLAAYHRWRADRLHAKYVARYGFARPDGMSPGAKFAGHVGASVLGVPSAVVDLADEILAASASPGQRALWRRIQRREAAASSHEGADVTATFVWYLVLWLLYGVVAGASEMMRRTERDDFGVMVRANSSR